MVKVDKSNPNYTVYDYADELPENADMGDVFRAHTKHMKAKKRERLAQANATDMGIEWHKFTEYHWRYTLNGKALDFWPSSGKFQYEGKIHHGDLKSVANFIAKRKRKAWHPEVANAKS